MIASVAIPHDGGLGGGDRSRGLALPARLGSTDAMTRYRTPVAAGPALVPPVLPTFGAGWMSRYDVETVEIPAGLLRRFTETLCCAANEMRKVEIRTYLYC